jgi:hypothetical protein
MRYLYIIGLVVILISCKKHDDAAEPNEYAAKFIADLNQSDTFRYETSIIYTDTLRQIVDSTFHNKKSDLERKLGLESLEDGYDSIQIRFSYSIAIFDEWVLIALRHNGIKWTGEVSIIKEHFSQEKETVDSLSRKIRFDQPKSGWIEFINKLFDLQVLVIEDQKIILNDEFASATDGDGVFFEIATPNVYRNYGYSNLDIQSKRFWQVGNVKVIKDIFIDEFEELKKADIQITKNFKQRTRNSRRERERKGKSEDKIKIKEMTIEDSINK